VTASILGHFDVSFRHFTLPLVLLILLLAPLPRMLQRLRQSAPVAARLLIALTALLAVSCLFTAVRTYPYYFPYLNALGLGRPTYLLASDSNVDWNQALPEVKRFADQHRLENLEIDTFGFNDPTVSVPRSQLWNCQRPTAADAGQWVVVSSNMVLDTHNCAWLLPYPREVLAGGGMYAIRLPSPIPSAGEPGGPPLPSACREFLGFPVDIRIMFLDLVRNPDKLPAAAAAMEAQFAAAQSRKRSSPAP
jgi:hypothetical protein